MIELQEIFNITYPPTLVFNQQVLDDNGIPFVSSRGTNNGITGRVKANSKINKYKAGSITVPLKGTVLQAFIQVEDFYCAHQIAVLSSKLDLDEREKLFYLLCIRENKYRYNYGRQADRTLPKLLIPSISEVPKWVYDMDLHRFDDVNLSFSNKKPPQLNTADWEWFTLEDLFKIKKGKRLTKANMKKGNTPFIASIEANNGYREYIGQKPIHLGNTITVNYNGSVAEAFYQPKPFWASDDVNVLYPKFKMNSFIALFIIPLIKMEKYRFNYGRKWHVERMNTSRIKLPIQEQGSPNFKFMEDYIKSLSFSKKI